MIVSTGYNGRDFILVNKRKEPVSANTVHSDFRGDTVTLTGGRAPHKPSSTGRVYVRLSNGVYGEFFPGVIDLVWVPIVSEGEA